MYYEKNLVTKSKNEDLYPSFNVQKFFGIPIYTITFEFSFYFFDKIRTLTLFR